MSSERVPGKYLTFTLCFSVFTRYSSIPAKIKSPTMRHVPFGKVWSGKTCVLFANVMDLSWYFLRISVNCSSHNGTLWRVNFI